VGLRAGLDGDTTWKIIWPCRGSKTGHPVCIRHYTDWANLALDKYEFKIMTEYTILKQVVPASVTSCDPARDCNSA
jgi:hypothetical protein